MDIATSLEEKRLQQIRVKMMKLTQTMALQKGDVRLYELFIDRWLKLPEKPYYQDYNDLRLDLLYLKDEKKLLRQLGIVYLDSIVDSRSVEDIIEKDQKRYDDYCRTHPSGSWIQEAMREGYRAVDAKLQVKAILEVGGRLLEDVNTSPNGLLTEKHLCLMIIGLSIWRQICFTGRGIRKRLLS